MTLWTSASEQRRAGLPVSSLSVVEGPQGRVLGAIDPDSELWPVLRETGRFAVSVLSWRQRDLAGAFAGTDPAPGGPFRLTEWRRTDWGPVPEAATTWVGCCLEDAYELGWSMLVTGLLEHIELADEPDEPDQAPLAHRRGRYFAAPQR